MRSRSILHDTIPQDMPFAWAVAPSLLGYLGVLQEGSRLVACVFGHGTELAATDALLRRCNQCSKRVAGQLAEQSSRQGPLAVEDGNMNSCKLLLERLVQFAAGQQDDFLDVLLRMSDRTRFQRQVLAACRAIPRGETRTYGELAVLAGSPLAARAVGQVMATNRVPLVVPCHRVVAANGKMGGFSAPRGVTMKRRLLELEGAKIFAMSN